MLEKIKSFLGITDGSQDAILTILIENAEAAFKDYTNQIEADPALVLKMAVEDFNRYGSEGLSNLSFGAANETVLADYSDGLQRQIRRHKKVKVI